MDKSEAINELAAALAQAQGQMEGAKKDADNPFFRSKYADLASVVAALREPFSTNGLAYVQLPVPVEGEAIAVDTVLMHASGQWIASRTVVPVTKQDAQGYGSALTYARRYGLQAIAGLAAEDDDGNAAAGAKPAPKAPRPAPAAKNTAAVETIEEQGDRLFKTPGEEERAEKIAVLEKIAKGYDALKMSPQMQAVLWKKHTASTVPMDPDTTSLDALNALLDELRALHRASESRKR